jgi:hypothetical protein
MICCLAGPAAASPPFLTDDPEPVDYRHWEFYTFSAIDKTEDGQQTQAPAFELNYGFAPNFQAHIVFPFIASLQQGVPDVYGPGDTELGIKYRFLQETAKTPMAGVFPMLELPTGDDDRGLGNGRSWVKLPLWLQKSWGTQGHQWTTYGGGGYAINTEPGQRNNPFGGLLLQRDLGEKLTLGGEIFAQGSTDQGGQSTLIANVGGYYNFTKDFSLLLSLGHSVAGEEHLIGYLGLYWTW